MDALLLTQEVERQLSEQVQSLDAKCAELEKRLAHIYKWANHEEFDAARPGWQQGYDDAKAWVQQVGLGGWEP